jgi:glycosyltransferase involved in cell wall biosynthesis
MNTGEVRKLLVSVITPVYNGELYLKEAITSIIKQTYTNIEYIIVNDGSTDGTRMILDQIKDPRVKVFHSNVNMGAAASLNFGIHQSSGEWIAIQDADDISELNRIEEQVNYIKSNPDAVAVSSLIENISGKTRLSDAELKLIQDHPYAPNSLKTREQILEFRFYGSPLCHGSVMFSRNVYFEVGGYNFNYRIAYDYELWMKIMLKYPIDKVNKVLYKWRVDPKSLHRTNEINTCLEVMQISTQFIKHHLLTSGVRNPRFILYGSHNACDFFIKNVGSRNKLLIKECANYDLEMNLDQTLYLYQIGKIDAIIALEDPRINELVLKLQKLGFVLNHNLFKIWNIVE